jgi:hypothetical protein
MAGITRFEITDKINGSGSWRFKDSKACWQAANTLYRKIFDNLEMPLEPGDDIIQCSKAEFMAGYDYALGIDVVLSNIYHQTMTMQEKFLFTAFDTVTVEYKQDWKTDDDGDWFKMKCQYYFVGYDYRKIGSFDNWIMLDWAQVQIASAKNEIPWKMNNNQKDGARASFIFVEFGNIPKKCVIARYNRPIIPGVQISLFGDKPSF